MDAKIEENTVQQILHSQHAMRVQVEQLLHANALQISSALLATQEKINPYDVDDMRHVLLGQKETFQDLTNKNAVLVTENSKLRMHLSFMPVEYRDFVANIQGTNGVLYTSQRRDPKVIIPRDDHTAGGNIALECKNAYAMQSTHPSNTQKLYLTKAFNCVQGSAPIKAQHASHSKIPPSRNTARSILTVHWTPCNRSSPLQHTLQAQLTSVKHPLRYATNMLKANDPWKVVDEDKSSKPQKLNPVLIATKGKAKHHPPLSFRDSGNITIPSLTLVNPQYLYELHKPKRLPKKNVQLTPEKLETLLRAAPTEEDITRSPQILEVIRSTELNAQSYAYEMH